MVDFIQGQRWVVDSEPDLGLGTVTFVEGRTVRIFFEQGDCERTYAIDQAPLTRIHFSVDDEVVSADGERYKVLDVAEQNGVYFYKVDDDKILPETALSSKIQLNQPFMRLMTGQLDKPRWFSFKRELSAAVGRVWQARLNGLLGVRANLIPHQLFVAYSACEHEKVRVLLADEVGLGKTIEAGMILSRLLKLERVERVVIAVPEALQVQWLVELIRRFSLTPELYSEEDHDFSSGQIHIVPHHIFASENSGIALAEFDMVIVDEAHHLTPESEAFASLKQLASLVDHLVLLTATPEQLGIESHFARLQLLDSAKFSSLDKFIKQEQVYLELNEKIKKLPESRNTLIKEYQLDVSKDDSDNTIITQLLDSHGIGRVMFRNVRSSIAGFPERRVHAHPIESDAWEDKFEWLARWLRDHTDAKTLVVCHSIDDVFACENYLWTKHGIDAATFHEEQSLIDRDRAAAYFADNEEGSQVLVCSEIGSEGRNFQFCSHLICLDLPDHPDLLEQRIGRLDRIGQKGDVNIHVPFSEGSPTERLFRWYHEVLDCIQYQNPAASPVHEEYWPAIVDKSSNDLEDKDRKEARRKMQALREDIKHGRDALLEMNSCRQPEANKLAESIEEFEKDTPLALVEAASDLLQFHFEETRQGAYSLIPSDKMLIPALPGIPPEGIEVTFNRALANEREELRFISWDAPLVQGLWELLQYSELGSAAVATFPSKQLPTGHCLLEACFDVVVQAEQSTECRPFLDAVNIRSLAIDVSDKNLSDVLPESALDNSLKDVKRHLAREIIKSKKDEIPAWYKKCESFAEKKKEQLLNSAKESIKGYYGSEINRLKQLKKRNALVDDADIALIERKSELLLNALTEHTHLHLSAIRLIVITD